MAPNGRSRPAGAAPMTFRGVDSSVPDLGPDLMSYTASEWRAWCDGYRVGRVHGIERGRELADEEGCHLIVTTGGTGISARDVTPEATRRVIEKELPGFGEAMRMAALTQVPTAILSRATAGTRGRCLIVNLPGKPTAVRECLSRLGPALREGVAHLRGEDPHSPVRQSSPSHE